MKRFPQIGAIVVISISCVLFACFVFHTFSHAQSPQEEWNKAVTLFNDGQEQLNHSNFHGAIVKWEEALSIFQKFRDKKAIGPALASLGTAYGQLGDYQKAISYYEQALTIAEEIGDKQSKGTSLGNLGNIYSDLCDYRKAISYHEQALAIAEEIGDKKGKGNTLNNLGVAYSILGDYRKAISYNEQTLAIFEEFGNKQGKGSVLGNMGNIYSDLGDYRKAISYHEQALAIAEEIGDKQIQGHSLNNIGNAYQNLGDYRKAISYNEQALAIAEEIRDKKGKGNTLGNLGVAYSSLGDYRKAISYYEQALAIAEEIGNKQGKGHSLNNIGNAYQDLGDYRKAISYYEQALAIAEEIGDKKGKGNTLNNLGVAYKDLGDYRKAIAYYEQALPLAEEIGDKQGKGSVLGNMGNIYSDLGDYRKAISYHEQALAIAEEIGDKQNKGRQLGNLGLAYSSLGDHRKAISYFEQAIAVKKEIVVPYDIPEGNLADTLLALDHDDEAFAIYTKWDHPIRLGRYYLKKKDFQEAKTQFDRDRESDEQRKEASFIIPRWIGLGLSHEGLREYDKAYEWYTRAIAFMEDQRASLTSAEREHYFEGHEFHIPRIEAYKGAARCTFMLGRLDDAFYLAENTRGRVLSELLSRRHSEESYKIPLELALSELRKGEHLIIIPDESLSLLPFEALLLDAPMEVLKEEATLLAQAKKQEEVGTVDRRAIIRGLSRQTTRGRGVTIASRVSTQILFDTDSAQISKESKKLMEEILAALKSKELNNAQIRIEGHTDSMGNQGYNLKLSRRRAEAVYQNLKKGGIKENLLSFTGKGDTEPVADNATEQGRKKNRRVDFVRVLEKKDIKSAPTVSRNLVYVMDEYPISYYQSASVLSLQRGLNMSRVKELTFFGLGDPVFDTQDKRSAGMRGITIVAKKDTDSTDITNNEGTKETGYRFSRLENTAKEVKEVSSLFHDSRVLIGPDASKNNLKKEDLTSRRYVLFSTHGILGNEIPYIKQPALVLNLVGNREEEGFLTATEIFNMNLNADLVGLSACQTGLGIQSAGEGVMGLSRAFMYAGTDSVLVSLWSVSDESTYKLMVRFFEGLKQGKDKLTALKEAKNYLRTNGYDNPFYWAPFILMGEAN